MRVAALFRTCALTAFTLATGFTEVQAQSGVPVISGIESLRGYDAVAIKVSTDFQGESDRVAKSRFRAAVGAALRRAGIDRLPEGSYPELHLVVFNICCIEYSVGGFGNRHTRYFNTYALNLRLVHRLPMDGGGMVRAATWLHTRWGSEAGQADDILLKAARRLARSFVSDYRKVN